MRISATMPSPVAPAASSAAAKSSTAPAAPNSPAWPAPSSAKQFSSCTSPHSTRPRQAQRSVATAWSGSAAKPNPGPGSMARSRRPASRSSADAEQDEVDVGIDRRAGLPIPLQHEGAQPLRVAAIGVDRLDRREGRLVPEVLAEGDLALPGARIVLAQVGDDRGQRRVEPDRAGLGQRTGCAGW
ncbi:MAG: hypothetical protein U1E53_33020 [Dongiaceae bacterium]